VTIAHHGLRDIEPIGLSIHAHDLASVAVGLDHIDEHFTIGDQLHERRASGVAVGLRLLGRVDVLQTHIDIASLRWPYEKAVTIEDAPDRAREIQLVRTRGG
jgi:hypothetical protein